MYANIILLIVSFFYYKFYIDSFLPILIFKGFHNKKIKNSIMKSYPYSEKITF